MRSPQKESSEEHVPLDKRGGAGASLRDGAPVDRRGVCDGGL